MLLKNKKAGEKLLSIWWIFIITMVGIGIVWGVSMFYSAEIDVRNVEAEILMNRISDCLFEQGMLINNLLENGFDIFQECKLNKKVIESNFYINISVLDESKKVIKEISEGIKESVCALTDSEKKGCVKKTRGIIYERENEIKIGRLEILTASNQVGEEISLFEGFQGGESGGGGAGGGL